MGENYISPGVLTCQLVHTGRQCRLDQISRRLSWPPAKKFLLRCHRRVNQGLAVNKLRKKLWVSRQKIAANREKFVTISLCEQ